MTLKKQLLLLLISLFTAVGSAQDTNIKTDFWNKVRFGGGLGLNFVNNGFNASIAPSAVYQVNNYFSLGSSLNLNYAKSKTQKQVSYGGSAQAFFNPITQLQGSIEYEQLRINRSLNTATASFEDNYWLPAFFIGLGYTTANVTVGFRYDLLYDEQTSIYGNALMPFMRVYF